MVWSTFTNTSLKNFATAITSDGLALERHFIDGVSFEKILESDREKSDLAQKYSIPNLLKQLVEIQRQAEQLLLETGVSIDVLTPKNFLVIGTGKNAILFPFDKGLVEPSKEAKDWYREHGFYIPDSIFKEDIQSATVWPLVPEHILYSKVWNLNLNQAMQYSKFLMNLESDEDAQKFIAQLEPLPFMAAPEIKSSTIIETCNLLLDKSP